MNGSASSVGTTLGRWISRIVPALMLATVAASAPARPGPSTIEHTPTIGSPHHDTTLPAARLSYVLWTEPRPVDPAMNVIVNTATNEMTGARLEEIATRSAFAQDAPFAEPAPSASAGLARPVATTDGGYGLPLPEPDGWAAVVATIALALFFFLRRTA